MFKPEVQEQVQKHYDELVKWGFNVVGVFLYGSQNYELDYEKSDVDTKAIILPSLDDIVFNRPLTSMSIDMGNNCLCDVKDIRKMFECFGKQNINFIEILFTKYYVINPLYKDLFQPILDHAEDIARYNNYTSVKCMVGMALEKYNALTHPYPSIEDKINKYGYDNKQLHHIIRLVDFLPRYCKGEEYRKILIPSNKDYLLRLKTEYFLSLEEAKKLAKESCDWLQEYKTNYMQNVDVKINPVAEKIMNDVKSELISFSIKRELMEDKE